MLQYIALLLLILVLLAIYCTIQVADIRRLFRRIVEQPEKLNVIVAKK